MSRKAIPLPNSSPTFKPMLAGLQANDGATGGHESAERVRRSSLLSMSSSESDTASFHNKMRQKQKQNAVTSSPRSGGHAMNKSTNSDSASEASRSLKPYRIKIASSTVRRHDRSFESSGTETEVRFGSKGRPTQPNVNYRRIQPLDIQANEDYHHPYAHQPTPFEKL